MTDKLTPGELRLLEILQDPAKWAESTLSLRNGPLRLRWYQKEILSVPMSGKPKSNRIVLRMGRRLGKTVTMATLSIWYAFTHKNAKILMAAPYDSQVGVFFKMVREMIESSPELADSVQRDTKNPQYIEFKNGSTLSGFTSGTKSGAKGDSMRGQAADWLILDEADRFHSDDYDSIAAIALEDPDRIGIIAASTPTGKRDRFYQWCNSPDWIEFHYPSSVSPTWSEDAEREFRNILSEQGYIHEVCLTPDTLVRTIDGMKRIDKINRADFVLTHKGHFKPVTELYRRDIHENIVHLDTFYDTYTAKLTKNHPVLAWQEQRCTKEDRPCTPHCIEPCEQGACRFIPAGNLSTNDYIAFPVPEPEIIPVSHIAIYDYLNIPCIASEQYIYANSKHRVPANMPVNEDLLYCLAAFLARGQVDGKSTVFTVESEYADELCAVLTSTFQTRLSVRRQKQATITLTNEVVANFLQNFFAQDHLPGWILTLPLEQIRTFMKAYLQYGASTHINHDRHVITCLLHSPLIAQDLHFLLLRLGIISSAGTMRQQRKQKLYTVLIRGPMFDKVLTDLFDQESDTGYAAKYILRDGYIYIPIRSVKHRRYKGYVYNLEVADDNSYCLSFKCVHNCAEWGEETIGVFQKRFIDLAKTVNPDAHYVEGSRNPARRVAGVDFDKYGEASQIVVLEYRHDFVTPEGVRSPKFQVVHRSEIPKSEFTLDNTVKRIIELNERFHLDFIYCDRGYGEYQIETLHKYGMQHPKTQLQHKVKGISFSSSIDLRDPFTKQIDKKPIKAFMVSQTSVLLEREQLILNPHDQTLWKQMEDYQVIRVTTSGQPVYTSENEHALDALMLSILGFSTEFPELTNIVHPTQVARKAVKLPRLKFPDKVLSGSARGVEEDEELWDPSDPEERSGRIIRHGKRAKTEQRAAKRLTSWGSRGATPKEPKRRTW